MIAASPLHSEVLSDGGAWTCRLARGQHLRLRDLSGQGICSLLCFHARDPAERYNMPDTLKAQQTARLRARHCLYSDLGRILLSIPADERGWHDPFGGYSHPADARRQYGERSYATHRNQRLRNTYENFLIELCKQGLDERDLHAPVNFFLSLRVADDGSFSVDADFDAAGQTVLLRAELDVLLVLSTAPHPLAPLPEWQPGTIEADIFSGRPAASDDACIRACAESQRAWQLTRLAALAYGGRDAEEQA